MTSDDLEKIAAREWDGSAMYTTFSHFEHPGTCVHLSFIPWFKSKTGYKCEWALNGKKISREKLDIFLQDSKA